MITQAQINDGTKVLNTLVQKAHESVSFKEQLINDPKATLSEVLGREYTLPEGKSRIVVEDQTDSSVIYFNIPSEPNLDEIELSEDQLEMVAGGITITVTSSNVCIGICVAGVCYLLGRNT